ncbi:hypothetical protein [Salmonella phage MBP4696116]|uniref:Uncharacterized protein n=1 Tax=Phage NBEco005 TaxID=2712974 RepID=A0A6G9LTE2_9CAUD|nr:hypothetical protein [Phage NBEco005]WJJ54279.1 hypothetical protein [Salmonella phage MBP4696116]
MSRRRDNIKLSKGSSHRIKQDYAKTYLGLFRGLLRLLQLVVEPCCLGS